MELTLKENPEYPLRCPITLFIALAFADHAFEHFGCPKDLLSYTLKPDKQSLEITMKPNVLHTPVFRMAEQRQISPTRAWTSASSASLTGKLSLQAGFEYQSKPYDVRRGFSNILDSTWLDEVEHTTKLFARS
jgi:hypothetical protein